MSVNEGVSGPRPIQVVVEISDAPEEVWPAIATGPRTSCWLCQTEIDECDGEPVGVKLDFGPGMKSRSEPKTTETTIGVKQGGSDAHAVWN